MEAEIILFITCMAIIGAGIGTFSGLIPGIHVNTLATLMLTSYPALDGFLSNFVPEGYLPVCVSSCVISAAVVHSFVDYVPSVFIGAPDPDDVASMLPGHRLLNEGRGMAAIRSAAIGSCVGSCVSMVIALPFRHLLLSGLGDYLDSITTIVLIAVVILMIIREDGVDKQLWSLALIILSGLLGLACMDLNIPSAGLLGEGTLLFPLLTGLFGMPVMLQSLKRTNMKKQTDDERYPVGPIPGIKGVLTGCITGWFPGITATAGAVLSGMVTPEKKAEGFISMVASIGTASSVLMLVTMSVSGKGRSGTMLVIGDILGNGLTEGDFLLLLFAISIATFLGYHLTIGCGKLLASAVSGMDLTVLNRSCIILVTMLVALMTGLWGVAILATATLLGTLPINAEVSRVVLTGCLLIPTLLTYADARSIVLTLLYV